jgi:hypothetical protein
VSQLHGSRRINSPVLRLFCISLTEPKGYAPGNTPWCIFGVKTSYGEGERRDIIHSLPSSSNYGYAGIPSAFWGTDCYVRGGKTLVKLVQENTLASMRVSPLLTWSTP